MSRRPALAHRTPELLDFFPLIEGEQRIDDRERPFDLPEGGAGMERTAQVGVKLPRRLEDRRLSHGTQLPQLEVEPGTGQSSAVALGDHPRVNRGMEQSDALSQLPVILSVHHLTQLLT